VTDGVNTAMNAVEGAGLDAPGDGLTVHADRVELRLRDHTVLSRGYLRDPRVITPLGAFLTHVRE
jgi:hypothetical protein